MSTMRHQLAGAPGTGTTVDNMGSRVKAWGMLNGIGTPALYSSLNVTSIVDIGVGNHAVTYTAAFSTARPTLHVSANSNFGIMVDSTATRGDSLTRTAANADVDTNFVSYATYGALA